MLTILMSIICIGMGMLIWAICISAKDEEEATEQWYREQGAEIEDCKGGRYGVRAEDVKS
jgi:hypothetical protein